MLAPDMGRMGLALPDTAKIHSGRGQYVLRNWLEAAFPDGRPFGPDHRLRMPIGRWLAEAGPRLAAPVARSAGVSAFCEPAAVERLFRNLGPGKRRGVGAAWQLVFFALWHRIHIEGQAPDGDTFAVLNAAV
jgi:asparagine synthase (glutamine-hydrolysing)